MFKTTLTTCLQNTDLDSSVCNDYRVLYKSRTRRWTLQDVQILFNNPLEDEQLGTGLYSISYAWGTIRFAHRKISVIKEEGKLVQKILTIYIAYEPESSNSIISHNQLSKDNPLPSRSEFEYIVKQTIRIQNSNICITETEGDRISAATYSEESTRLILEKENSYLISQELQMWLTLEIDQSLKLEQCAAEENMKKNQQWFFQTINTNPDIVENFPDATLEDIQEVRLEQRKAVKTTMNSPIFGGILKTNHGSGNIIWDMIAWRFLKNGQYPNEKCVTHHGLDEQLTAENCYTDWTKCQDELKTLLLRTSRFLFYPTFAPSLSVQPVSQDPASTSANETSTWQHPHCKSSIITSIIAIDYCIYYCNRLLHLLLQSIIATFITSSSLLVQSQVSVGNCSKVTNKGHPFEYTSDFTITPFNTNACVKHTNDAYSTRMRQHQFNLGHFRTHRKAHGKRPNWPIFTGVRQKVSHTERYIVSGKAITPSKKKSDAIIKYRAPKNVKELSSFLGLASYYRKFILAFADKVHPLTALTRKSAEWKWGEEQTDAFECIKNCLITRPVLGYPDFSREFIIYTDASGYGIGAALAQTTTSISISGLSRVRRTGPPRIRRLPMRNQTAQTIAKVLANKIYTKYGSPEIVLTDQGSNFLSSLIQDVCKLLKMKQIRTMAYHPQTDGLVERFNRTLCDMIGCYVSDQPPNWDKYLPFVTFAYNTAKQASTQETPFFLFFGREPVMPNDIKINRRYEICEDTSMVYSQQWGKAQNLEREHLFKSETRQKKYIDVPTKIAIYNIAHCKQETEIRGTHQPSRTLHPKKTKNNSTEEEEILQNLPENIEAQRRPKIHQRRPGRLGKQQLKQKLITPLECWQMVNDKKCGENNMQVGPNGLTFTATLTGEGKWYAIKKYHTLNCIAEQVTLRQEKPDQPIESPFGLLHTTQQEGQFTLKQNIIVWGKRTTNYSFSQTLLKGNGYLEIPRSPERNNSSRLYDDNRQLEISFFNKPDKHVTAVGYKLIGIPLTYLTFPAETKKILYEMFKNTIATCLKNTNLATPSLATFTLIVDLDCSVWFLHGVRKLEKRFYLLIELITKYEYDRWKCHEINHDLRVWELFLLYGVCEVHKSMTRDAVESKIKNWLLHCPSGIATNSSIYAAKRLRTKCRVQVPNELPYWLRRSNILLFAIWYGNKKPSSGPFLEASISELQQLGTKGVQFNQRTYLVKPLILTTDSMARRVFLNGSTFRGDCGCDFCLHPGEMIKIGRESTRVYPEPTSNPTFAPRTVEKHECDLMTVLGTGKRLNGIKGPSPFLVLLDFDYVQAQVPDYLHCVCHGGIKFLVALWTETKYFKQPWYLDERKWAILNARLMQIKPHYEITWTSSPLSDISQWKASNFRGFALYYFTALEDLLPKVYFHHFLCLIYDIQVLLQEEVTVNLVLDVDFFLQHFVRDAEVSYRQKNMRFNFHLTTHLVRATLNWGYIWSWSTFIPEWFNGVLVSSTNKTQCVTEQMVKSLLMKKAVRSDAITLMLKYNLPQNVSVLFKDFLNISHHDLLSSLDIYSSVFHLKLLGVPKKKFASKECQSAIHKYFSSVGKTELGIWTMDSITFPKTFVSLPNLEDTIRMLIEFISEKTDVALNWPKHSASGDDPSIQSELKAGPVISFSGDY
ncbi:Uncharacterized protein APZ42_034224 [Daphnia magna]|uniref:RNA-directed DNA polymerase n=1 Tax=Daphnia magna TaxID=35525 RepID=A0A164KB84_9CRUS|nr:Uncharacterized protein APZ42_034224 [Daphnia magna]